MRILLVVDGSSYSDTAAMTLQALRLSPQTEVTVMTVVPEHTFLGGVTLDTLRHADRTKKDAQRKKAEGLVEGPVVALSASGLKAEGLVRWGNPAELILKTAAERDASLLAMGAKGLSDRAAFRLGSVALKVMKYAPCSVLLARGKAVTVGRGPVAKKPAVAIGRILLAADGSRYSERAAQFLLELPIPQRSGVILVTVLQSHVAALLKTPSLDLEANRQLLADLQAAEEKEAAKIIARGERQFQANGYRTTSMIVRGEAGESILEAARETAPDIIAMGSRGLTGIESFLLGSVAERVARYAPCSVLIVKPPAR